MKAGSLIKRMRKEKKYTQEKLADAIQTDKGYISRIENNKQQPSIGILEKIAKVLDCEVHDFFIEEQPAKELRGKVEWVKFIDTMENKQLTPEEITKIIEVFEMMREKS